MESNLFGEYLKKRRKEMNLTLKDLADNIRLTHGYISNVENGKMKGNLDLIEGIQVILQIPITDSIIRLKIDKGELQKLEDELETTYNVDYTDLLVEMITEKPGKYYLLTRRLMSLKTLIDISVETGLDSRKILEIEEHGPKNEDEDDLNRLGRCYGIEDITYYLLNIIGIPRKIDTNIFDGIINGYEVSELYQLQALWDVSTKNEFTQEEINLTEEYEKFFTEEFIKQNAINNLKLKSDDIYFRLNELHKVYFKGKSLSIEDKNKARKILELVFDVETADKEEEK